LLVDPIEFVFRSLTRTKKKTRIWKHAFSEWRRDRRDRRKNRRPECARR